MCALVELETMLVKDKCAEWSIPEHGVCKGV